MGRRKYFFPSEHRKRRRVVAMAERRLEGKPWKHPHETWEEKKQRDLHTMRDLLAESQARSLAYSYMRRVIAKARPIGMTEEEVKAEFAKRGMLP